MKPRPEQEYLILEARKNAADVRVGKATLLPTSVLASKFGYTPDAAKQVFGRVGLNKERQDALRERLSLPYTPSVELAWLMGYFSEHGSPNANRIAVTDEDPERRKKFTKYSEIAFSHTPTALPDVKKNDSVLFIYSKEIVSRVGDISQKNYPSTLKEKYAWLLKDQKFAWAFIEGLFDSKAYVAEKRININSTHEILIDHIIDILRFVNVYNPTKNYLENNKCWVLNIQRERDLKEVAQHIKLVSMSSTDKDAHLKKYRPHRAHHWRIDTPNGATSAGVCIECGAQREFSNSIKEDYEFNRTESDK